MVRLIAIVEKNFGLALWGKIPWESPCDMRLFRQLTLDSTVIMGRNTFFSHKNIPLKNRINCVISSTPIDHAEVENFSSLESAIEKHPDCWIIGGASVYNYALERCIVDEAVITQVRNSHEADRFLNKNLLKNFSKELMKETEEFLVWKYSHPNKY